MASAFTDQDPLEGPYADAANLDGEPGVSPTDLVKLAQKFRSGSLDVEYTVADKGGGQVLEEAGYDIAPWTDELAVFRADIPENAQIENIAWTQYDIFPDGREQELYYEGPEESLIFGTYTEGHTTVTTVVTTQSGKTGTRQTEIDWSSGGQTAKQYADPEPTAEGELLGACAVIHSGKRTRHISGIRIRSANSAANQDGTSDPDCGSFVIERTGCECLGLFCPADSAGHSLAGGICDSGIVRLRGFPAHKNSAAHAHSCGDFTTKSPGTADADSDSFARAPGSFTNAGPDASNVPG